MLTLSGISLVCCSTYPEPYLSAQTLVYKIYSWVSFAGHDFFRPRLRSWSFRFCLSILLLAFYPYIVYPHIGDLSNLTRCPPLKPNIIFCDYLLDHNLSLRMDRQLNEDCKTTPRLKISNISPKEKYSRYLPYLYHLFARGRANI
jgi:hypothetical protein